MVEIPRSDYGRTKVSEQAKCGCFGYLESKPPAFSYDGAVVDDANCLYPQSVAHVAELEARLASGYQIITDLINKAAWCGPEIRAAEKWLEANRG